MLDNPAECAILSTYVDTNTTFVWRTCLHPDLPMPAYVRRDIVDEDRVGVYHCIARCVRRAFLCGTDSYTGRDYGHRKAWVLDRLRQLAGLFGVEVCDYAIMSNHLQSSRARSFCAAPFASGDALPPVRLVARSGGGLRARASDQGFLPIDTQKYVMLLDWTGREIRENKCGAIPDNLAPILDRLGLDRSNWVKTVREFGRMFKQAAGRASSLARAAPRCSRRWFQGRTAAQAAFV